MTEPQPSKPNELELLERLRETIVQSQPPEVEGFAINYRNGFDRSVDIAVNAIDNAIRLLHPTTNSDKPHSHDWRHIHPIDKNGVPLGRWFVCSGCWDVVDMNPSTSVDDKAGDTNNNEGTTMDMQSQPAPKKSLVETVVSVLNEDIHINREGADLRQPPIMEDDYDSWKRLEPFGYKPELWTYIAESVIRAIDRYRAEQ